MVTINLLPWRQQLKKYQDHLTKKIFVISIIFSLLTVWSAHFYITLRKEAVGKNVSLLREKIENMTNLNEVSSPETGSLAASKLKKILKARDQLYDLFFQFNRKPLAATCFDHIYKEHDKIIFAGRAKSVSDLLLFLKTSGITQIYSAIKINELKFLPDQAAVQFELLAESESFAYAAV